MAGAGAHVLKDHESDLTGGIHEVGKQGGKEEAGLGAIGTLFRVGANVFHSSLSSFIPSPPFELKQEPHHIIWHITNRCPLGCKYCFTDSRATDETPPRDVVLRIAERIVEAGAERISIIGGEPLTVPWLPEALRIIKEGLPDSVVNLDSNLTLFTPEFYEKVKDYVDVWNTTLDSIRPEEHNETRGLWHKTVSAIRFLTSHGERVHVVIVATAVNEDSYKETVEFLKSIGADPVVSRGHPVGRGRFSCYFLERERVLEMKDRLTKLPNIGFFGDGFHVGDAPSCYCGVTRWMINWRGQLFPCEMMLWEDGPSILDRPIREVMKEWEWWGRVVMLYPAVCESCPVADRCVKSCRYITMLSSGNPLARPVYCVQGEHTVYDVIGYEYYSPIYPEGRSRWNSPTADFLREASKFFKPPVVEAGSGAGVWLAFLEKELGITATGVEMDPSMLQLYELYREKEKLRSTAIRGDILDYRDRIGTLLALDNLITYFPEDRLRKLFSLPSVLVLEFQSRTPPESPRTHTYRFANRLIVERQFPAAGRAVWKEVFNGYVRSRFLQYFYTREDIEKILADLGYELLLDRTSGSWVRVVAAR